MRVSTPTSERPTERVARVTSGFTEGPCTHQLIEAQVERTPHAIAVVSDAAQATYGEINARANQLARVLRRTGVGPEAIVGLCVERSIDMVVGILGILKAGGAYLPLDPEYPADHLSLVLNDANVSVVVTQEGLMNPTTSTWQRPLLSVVVLNATLQNEETANLINSTGPENLAYLIYTSGSSGRPKGIMVTHRNLVHSTNARLSVYRDPVESFLLLPPFTFDASVAVIFWTLCTGGRLVLPPKGAEREPSEICRLILLHSVSHVLCVGSLYAYILDVATREALAAVRIAIVGGEVCSPLMLSRHRDKAPHASLFNEYGPTECTVWSTVYEVSRHLDETLVPIGHPIANTQLHILDRELQPVPEGASGELHIAGDGVARGYLNRPELTAERFIPNRFASDPSARLYKTGDLARYRADGNIEFLGRLDRQVKIRGVRIEPEEIETVLTQHPFVRSAFVVAHDDPGGGKRLVAYIEGQTTVPLVVTDLRSFLKEKLPDIMVPSAFVFLDSLPRTPAGKVDQGALPLPVQQQPAQASSADSTPLQALEYLLRETWEEILGVRPIGLDENFFELGGHSLLAAELFIRMEALTGRQLPLASLLDAPTIRELGSAFRQTQSIPASSVLVPVQRHGSRPPFFCVPGTEQSALHYAPLARHLGRNQPLYALVADMNGAAGVPYNRIEDIAARYIGEMRRVQPDGSYFVAGNSFGGLIAYEIAWQLEAQGLGVRLLILFDTPNPGSRTLRYRRFAARVFRRAQLHLRRLASEPHPLAYARQRLSSFTRLLQLWLRDRPPDDARKPRSTSGLRKMNAAQVDQLAYLRYVPRPYSGHLTLFRALGAAREPVDPALGWRTLVRSVEVREVPGEHMTILREPHVRILAEQLSECLVRAQHDEASLSVLVES